MARTNPISAVLIIIITIFLPPVGVFMIAGCGADLFVNICLTILGDRRSQARAGHMVPRHAPGVYSQNVQTGGMTTYGTVPT
ncbi:hypothetical protein MMC08_007902 [Hypocenomyce scalaris]|nr:hypothetical protein [Hypocenomyce scalaris]